MENIQDISIYNQRMSAGIEDKLFFTPFLRQFYQPILFVDVGCADGEILNYLLKSFPNLTAIGIDNNLEMRKLFLEKNREFVGSRAFIYSSLSEFGRNLKESTLENSIKIIHLCSVMHEIHHYLIEQELTEFYKDLIELPFDYIVMRDMYCPETKDQYCTEYNYKQLMTYANSHKNFQKQLNEFKSIYGDIVIQKNFLHFLMKYMYTENWDRECQENYFPDIWLDKIKKNYESIYEGFYQLPYLTSKWKKDFKIQINENTHMKMIFKRKK